MQLVRRKYCHAGEIKLWSNTCQSTLNVHLDGVNFYPIIVAGSSDVFKSYYSIDYDAE